MAKASKTTASTSKASKPELIPLDRHLAALLNPALNQSSARPSGFEESPQARFAMDGADALDPDSLAALGLPSRIAKPTGTFFPKANAEGRDEWVEEVPVSQAPARRWGSKAEPTSFKDIMAAKPRKVAQGNVAPEMAEGTVLGGGLDGLSIEDALASTQGVNETKYSTALSGKKDLNSE